MEVHQVNDLNSIPHGDYEGYLWYSNEKNPTPVHSSIGLSNTGINPFIIEGLLFDRETNVSIHIQHVDQYLITIFRLSAADYANSIEKEYLPHRLSSNIDKVCFRQIWKAEGDPHCEGMDVQKLEGIVFTGFKTNK